MRFILSVLLVLCSFFFATLATANGLGDIFRQGGSVFTDTQRNQSYVLTDAERRKQGIESDAQRQIADLETMIEGNNHLIDNNFEPQIIDARVDLRALERDYNASLVSYRHYLSKRRTIEERVNGLQGSIAALNRQNAEYTRRQREIRVNADAQKRQVDIGVRANIDQSTTRQNSDIVDTLIRGIFK